MNYLEHECGDCTSLYYVAPEIIPVKTNPIWSLWDYLGAIKVRSSLARNNYKVEPGLYTIGKPNSDSEVLISANYKLSFDLLRRELKGLSAWIVVLDTKGVNVWCAAGKGTFGTTELIHQIEQTGIKSRINHKRIIVPQLGAPGISAHKVKEATGLNIKYGPVRASDIKEFLAAGNKASAEMRRVKFPFIDRLTLTPVEVVYSGKYLLLAISLVFVLSGFEKLSFDVEKLISEGIINAIGIIGAFFSGTVLGPLLLPVLPFRSFSLKGLFSGLFIWIIFYLTLFEKNFTLETASLLLASLALGSFFTMNFTGASTYTSLSGVQKEMKYAVPAQIAIGIVSVALFITSIFI